MSNWLYLPDLEKELDDLNDLFDETGGHLDDEEDKERRDALQALADELGGTLSSQGDETLIPQYDFEDYAREFAYDIGMVERDSSIEMYVAWEKWSNDLAMDYTSVTFDGTDYYIRPG